MKMKTFESWKPETVRGARVFLRVDMNVPIAKGKVLDDSRIRAALPTLRALSALGARTIVASHLGRPDGKRVAPLSMRPVAARLAKLLGAPVAFVPESVGPKVAKAVARLKPGGFLMLENLRFEKGEGKADPRHARALAACADLYVDDAFASAHRDAASISVVPRYLPAAAGLLLAKEVETLSGLLEKPAKPFLALIGGVKVETKIGVINALAKRASAVALGGSLVAPFLKAKGFPVGKSPASAKDVAVAKRALRSRNVLLPVDVTVAVGPKGRAVVRDVAEVGARETIYDIGPETIRAYAGLIKRARTIVWNGPLGWFEEPRFSHGTKAIALVAASRAKGTAFGVVGGGETVQAIEERGLAHWFDFVSTGGGAMLEFLEGKKLPGVEALKVRSK